MVFIYPPISEERWDILKNKWPKEQYWDPLMKQINTSSVHFKDYTELCGFKVNDTAHLDNVERVIFTERLLNIMSDNEML